MTKAAERELLTKIQKLIDSAGADSYIAAAFNGCVELAESNIENDFCESWKERALHAITRNSDMESALKRVDETLKERDKLIDQLEAELANTCQRAARAQIPAAVYRDVWLELDAALTETNARIADITENLAQFAAAPNDIAVPALLHNLGNAVSRRNELAETIHKFEAFDPNKLD